MFWENIVEKREIAQNEKNINTEITVDDRCNNGRNYKEKSEDRNNDRKRKRQ